MSIANSVQELGSKLKKCQWKLVTAESCTGGGLAYKLTSIAGSSDWFEAGLVTYSNFAKLDWLDLPVEVLEEFGAVSEQTARAMAEGALKRTQAQVSMAVTGIAGPDGGTPEKPVGTVWLAWKTPSNPTQARLLQLSGDRRAIREQTIEIAISELISAFD